MKIKIVLILSLITLSSCSFILDSNNCIESSPTCNSEVISSTSSFDSLSSNMSSNSINVSSKTSLDSSSCSSENSLSSNISSISVNTSSQTSVDSSNSSSENSSSNKEEQPILTSNSDYIHFSFDDVSCCFKNLVTNNYNNLFEEPFFNNLKELNELYDAKFSLYTYTNVLKQVSDKYKEEFSASSDWLKVGFHSSSSGFSLTNSNYNDGKKFWEEFVLNVEIVCGSINSLDKMPRLEYFSGSYDVIQGMKDASNGALGFLSSDDNRLSYYFNKDVMEYLYKNDYLKDENNNLTFLSTDIRGDWFYNFSSNNQYITPIKDNIYDELIYRNSEDEFENSIKSLIIFTHEWLVYDGININNKFSFVTNTCKFAYDYNLSFDYPQNREYKNKDDDRLFEKSEEESQVTLKNRTLNILSNKDNLIFEKGYSLAGGSGSLVSIVGRATDLNNVLSNVNGKTFVLAKEELDGKKLFYSLVEFKEDGNINPNGLQARIWLEGNTQLDSETKYVLIAFRNGNGSEDFKEDNLQELNNCFYLQ